MCDPCQWYHPRLGCLWCPSGAVGRPLMPLVGSELHPDVHSFRIVPLFSSICLLGCLVWVMFVLCLLCFIFALLAGFVSYLVSLSSLFPLFLFSSLARFCLSCSLRSLCCVCLFAYFLLSSFVYDCCMGSTSTAN